MLLNQREARCLEIGQDLFLRVQEPIETQSRSIITQKIEVGQYPAILTEQARSMKDFFLSRHHPALTLWPSAMEMLQLIHAIIRNGQCFQKHNYVTNSLFLPPVCRTRSETKEQNQEVLGGLLHDELKRSIHKQKTCLDRTNTMLEQAGCPLCFPNFEVVLPLLSR